MALIIKIGFQVILLVPETCLFFSSAVHGVLGCGMKDGTAVAWCSCQKGIAGNHTEQGIFLSQFQQQSDMV